MKIIFYSNQLTERGTETALIDYAYACQNILKYTCILAFPKERIFDKERYFSLKKDFEILETTSICTLKTYITIHNVDLLYIISPGRSHDIADDITECKTFVHCVFSTARKHGTYYITIHDWVNKAFHTNYKVLPHIVKKINGIKTNLKNKLNIPENALVFGSYGGKDQFNIDFVKKTIKEIAISNPSIFFIFMNIRNFTEDDSCTKYKNIIFLEGSSNQRDKIEFINTCDAMIHARKDGETFGLSIAEFSVQNKPIITFNPGFLYTIKDNILDFLGKRRKYDRAHIMNLGKKGFYYKNKKTLKTLLIHFQKFVQVSKNDENYFDVFSQKFSPEKVINIFNKIISK